MKDDSAQKKLRPSERITAAAAIEIERSAIAYKSRFRFLHWFVLLASAVLTLVLWQYSRVQVDARTNTRFTVASDPIPLLILERLQKYELALWGGVSARQLWGSETTLDEWQHFAVNLDIENRFPGINGIGMIHQVAADKMDAYLAAQRQVRPDFGVYPAADREVYAPITFIEPVDINKEAVGLDMMHETNRKTGFMQARDTGEAQITGPIVLVQDQDRTPGFLFFAPFYDGDDPGTLDARRDAFLGTVYAPFIVNKLIAGVLDQDLRSVLIRVSDGNEIIYDELDDKNPDYDSTPVGARQVELDVYGRTWTIDILAGLAFRRDLASYEPTAILITGALIDLALLWVFLSLTGANRRGLRFADMATGALQRETEALRKANEELVVARRQAESGSAAKSSFLSTMSHEVRTPLTAISGIMVLLDRAGLTDQQRKLVQAGTKASDRLMKLLTEVLDVSRLEAKAVRLWRRELKMSELVEDWRILGEGIAERLNKPIVVRTVIEDTTPERVYVDDLRLSQVINNLVDNAVRFTEQGEIEIRTFSQPSLDDVSRKLVISVRDTGIGLSQDDIDVIFEKFRQVDGSITRQAGGSGLGLSICCELVQLMGGDINVSSTLEVGSNFEVVLPLEEDQEEGDGVGAIGSGG